MQRLFLALAAALACSPAFAQSNPGFTGGAGAPPLTAAALNNAFAAKQDTVSNLLPFTCQNGTGATVACGNLKADVTTNQGTTIGEVSSSVVFALSISPAITAAGTTQATATPLTTNLSVVTAAPVSSGVIVPFIAGAEFQVFNRGSNAVLVYPPVGASIDGNTINLGMSVAAGAHYALVCYSATACLSE